MKTQTKADEARFRALLDDHLGARLALDGLERAVGHLPDPTGSYAASMDKVGSKARDAERDLRAAVLRAVGLDPRLPVPRPIAAGVSYYDGGQFIVVVVPDPNASVVPDPKDGRRYNDGVRDRDVLDVVKADGDDWLPWYMPYFDEKPAKKKAKGKKAKKRGRA
ncbi:MAG: hypothetical protein BGO49_11525 [Planctomycetales bacterium 71-10]|nr:MAG: hypothetical protein BGO49_11525 [Planctomycetales bacterium 71-10]